MVDKILKFHSFCTILNTLTGCKCWQDHHFQAGSLLFVIGLSMFDIVNPHKISNLFTDLYAWTYSQATKPTKRGADYVPI